jgi:hypothetical protein
MSQQQQQQQLQGGTQASSVSTDSPVFFWTFRRLDILEVYAA